MRLLLTRPEIPSCADCRKWLYGPNWKPFTRGGKPVERLPDAKGRLLTPCWNCPKSIDKATPNPDAELWEKNLRAYWYYLSVKSGAGVSIDRIVERNCRWLRLVEDQIERAAAQPIVIVPGFTNGK